MRILKSHPLLKLVNSYVIDSPQPSNISYAWNFGSLLGFCLVIQIITGVTLAMHYNPSILEVSVFFFIVYLQIGIGLYYISYKATRTLVWTIGTVVFILMMATTSLGYIQEPKSFKLSLIFFNISVQNSFIISLFLLLFTVSLVLFYLDNFKLSPVKSIKYFQLFSFIGMLFILVVLVYNIINYLDVISYINDKNNAGLHGEYNVSKESAESIGNGMSTVGQGLSTIGSNLGLGGTMVGISAAVSRGIAKSGMPPLQKAGTIVGSAVIGGFYHTVYSGYNRSAVKENTLNTNISCSANDIGSNVSKFMEDPSWSALETILFGCQGSNAVSIGLMITLAIQIVYKLYLKDNIKLNLTSILGVNFNNIIENYINKIIRLNKKISVFYIWFILVIVILGLSLPVYVFYDLYNNGIDRFIAEHNNIYGINNSNISYVKDGLSPLRAMLLKLCCINSVCLSLVIVLSIQIISKLHLKDNIKLNLTSILSVNLNNIIENSINKIIRFNRKTNVIYMLLILVIVIFGLSLSVYISNDLFNNINNYIAEYNYFKNK